MAKIKGKARTSGKAQARARRKLIADTSRVWSRLTREYLASADLSNWIDAILRKVRADSPLVLDIPNLPAKFTRLTEALMIDAMRYGYWFAHSYIQDIRALYGARRDGDEELKKKLKIQLSDWDEVLPEDAINWIKTYVPTLAGNLEESVRVRVRDTVLAALMNGEPIRETTKALEPVLKNATKARLETIARTEITRADTMGRLVEYKENEDVEGVEFSAILDDRTTAICEARHGLVMRLDDPRLARNSPPLHPNCRSLLLAVTIYDKKPGWQTSPEFDDAPEGVQRDEDVEEVQKILDSNELTTEVVRENIPDNDFVAVRPLAVEKGPSERLVLDVPDDKTLDLNFVDNPREYTEATLEQADKDLWQATAQGWLVLDDVEKDVGFRYTDNSSAINGSLYSGKGPIHEDVEPLTRLIEKMPRTEFDMYVWRGSGLNSLVNLFGRDVEILQRMTNEELQILVKKGVKGRFYNFISTSVTRERSYAAKNDVPVEMKILILKGTEAVYLTPFSREGPRHEDGINWNGLDPTPILDQHPYRKDEIEILIQRGAFYEVTKAKKNGKKLYLELTVRLEQGYNKFQ